MIPVTRCTRGSTRLRPSGIALVAVLWVVAALSLTLTGAVYVVRNEIKAASNLREMTVDGVLNDAAIVLAARELKVPSTTELTHFDAEFEGQTIGVEIVSLTGLIDLNSAGENLLSAMFAIAGGVEPAAAASLAQNVLDWRDPDDQPRPQGAEKIAYEQANSPFRPRNGPFDVPEDLLQVLGVDYDVYDKVKRLITVNLLNGNGQVDPTYAPLAVLQVMAGSNQQIASDYVNARKADGALADSTRFPAEFSARRKSPRFLLVASMPLANGARFVTRKVVDMSLKQEGRPWTVIWSERSIDPATAQ